VTVTPGVVPSRACQPPHPYMRLQEGLPAFSSRPPRLPCHPHLPSPLGGGLLAHTLPWRALPSNQEVQVTHPSPHYRPLGCLQEVGGGVAGGEEVSTPLAGGLGGRSEHAGWGGGGGAASTACTSSVWWGRRDLAPATTTAAAVPASSYTPAAPRSDLLPLHACRMPCHLDLQQFAWHILPPAFLLYRWPFSDSRLRCAPPHVPVRASWVEPGQHMPFL